MSHEYYSVIPLFSDIPVSSNILTIVENWSLSPQPHWSSWVTEICHSVNSHRNRKCLCCEPLTCYDKCRWVTWIYIHLKRFSFSLTFQIFNLPEGLSVVVILTAEYSPTMMEVIVRTKTKRVKNRTILLMMTDFLVLFSESWNSNIITIIFIWYEHFPINNFNILWIVDFFLTT